MPIPDAASSTEQVLIREEILCRIKKQRTMISTYLGGISSLNEKKKYLTKKNKIKCTKKISSKLPYASQFIQSKSIAPCLTPHSKTAMKSLSTVTLGLAPDAADDVAAA